jgi:hypothetical protein
MARTRSARSRRTSRAAARRAAPKRARSQAAARRRAAAGRTTAEKIGRTLDAVPDRIDIRDWFFQPRLMPLPKVVVNCDSVPEILDQGNEGACTGYALAAVIRYHLNCLHADRAISPRMLYEMARRYDEWPGERYEGSSARGAMIGWVRHGVCADDDWPAARHGSEHFTPSIARRALQTPGGAYYRVMHTQVRDMHAALAENGILYCTLMVHEGWDDPDGPAIEVRYPFGGRTRTRSFKTIKRRGRADGGHAVAIVGYTFDGLIIQNSWGKSWGTGGFALLPYADFLLHATDVWVAQLGVPVGTDLWVDPTVADTKAGLQRAAESIPLEQIRPFVVDVGNNGRLSDSGQYWTTQADVARLFNEIIPQETAHWRRRRVLLYFHGGLNDERAAAQRVLAFKNILLANEIYPLHIMWETGAYETLANLIEDYFVGPDPRAGGVGDWLSKAREHLLEAKDLSFEMTVARLGTALWQEMKENARLASLRSDGALRIVADEVRQALAGLSPADRNQWELHVVGHSAGSIVIAHALPHILEAGLPLKTMQFMAPAIRVDEFKALLLPAIRAGTCPHPSLYVLSDEGEQGDHVGPVGAYGKSLLYLVSNAFEGRRGVPLLGMQKFISTAAKEHQADPELNRLFRREVGDRPSLIVAGARTGGRPDPASDSRSDSHGGFDNDEWTMNSILHRILGRRPDPKFDRRDLQYGAVRRHAPDTDRRVRPVHLTL